ncbi:MAG: GntR family transcriptional regulator [[Eubacterium] siraeum]
MFSLRLQGGIPLSEQLEARIAELIIGGEMAENEKLPAVREVAKALTINPNTVQKTYRQLEQRGLIFASGKGSYVAERSQYSCGA